MLLSIVFVNGCGRGEAKATLLIDKHGSNRAPTYTQPRRKDLWAAANTRRRSGPQLACHLVIRDSSTTVFVVLDDALRLQMASGCFVITSSGVGLYSEMTGVWRKVLVSHARILPSEGQRDPQQKSHRPPVKQGSRCQCMMLMATVKSSTSLGGSYGYDRVRVT
jgi:hypothetical protein